MDYLIDFFNWLLAFFKDLLTALIIPVLELVGNLIPDGLNTHLEGLLSYGPIVNTWVPLELATGLWIAYMGIKSLLIVIKYVLKGIPTIWG